MKRLLALILVLTLLVVTGTIVAADAQTRRESGDSRLITLPVSHTLTIN